MRKTAVKIAEDSGSYGYFVYDYARYCGGGNSWWHQQTSAFFFCVWLSNTCRFRSSATVWAI